ncbi:dnaJ protein ERDJ3A [Aristolochia californica]|uniref:dnaJ protein ERDJ3A n=1 Tax=Aristolochia californica TaxID=171875 RepID=UPI0035DF06FA
MAITSRFLLYFLLCVSLYLFFRGAEGAADLYQVLGVEKNASQREIQKAFHKLSLKYHPDKNKAKGAQEKFAEINNAYEILSDEVKRKNYDTYGDENGGPRFDAGNNGGKQEGYTYFTGGQGNNRFSFRPGGQWHTTGSQGKGQAFSFSFGGNPTTSGNSGFGGFDDIFSNFFGGNLKSGNQFGGSDGGRSTSDSPLAIQNVNSQVFKKEILDKGLTWILLFYTPSSKGYNVLESIVEDVVSSLQEVVKGGSIDCQTEQALCKELGVSPSKSAKLFIYSYRTSEKASLVEYTGDWDAKDLKIFCQDQLPRFSKRINLGQFGFLSSTTENLPRVLLLSTKKTTPVIWRALSGLYRRRFIFYDAQVYDSSDSAVKSLGVDVLPAVIGWLSNGEKHVLRTGPIKDLKSGMRELRTLLDTFEKKNKKVSSSHQTSKPEARREEKLIPELVGSNMDTLCGEKIPVCIIGVFRSPKAKEKLESILSAVSQKTLTRPYNKKDTISYSLLDATKQAAFLSSLDKAGFKSMDNLLVAYKPRKEKFAVFKESLTVEEVERFIGSVLNGDVQFTKSRKKPVLK